MLKASKILRGITLEVVQGDLTNESVEAIVNAANHHLAHGGGVAAAIVQKGGRIIQEKSDEYIRIHGNVPTGTAVHTIAGKLNCKFVIHTVGPVWRGHSSEDCLLLKNAVMSSYNKAEELSLSSIALPAISSGIFGFPKELCAKVIMSSTKEFIESGPKHLRLIKFVNFDSITSNIMKREFESLFEGESVDEEKKVLEIKDESKNIIERVEQLKIDEKEKVDGNIGVAESFKGSKERKEVEKKDEIKEERGEEVKENNREEKKERTDPVVNLDTEKKVAVGKNGGKVEESKIGKKVGALSNVKKIEVSKAAKIGAVPSKGGGNITNNSKKTTTSSIDNKPKKK